MTQEKSSNPPRQPVSHKDSWNGVANLRPQSSQSTPSKNPNTSNPSASSGGSNSGNTSGSGNGK